MGETVKALTRFDEPELATLLTPGGEWTADDYLRLSGRTNRLVEFTGGCIEVLPMPTDQHQAMVETLFLLLRAYAARTHGKARFAPLRLRIGAARYREPDILFLRSARDPRRQDRFWTGADLVAEVVSPDDPERDRTAKRSEYAAAGIPEYWIVDPPAASVTVLRLADGAYVEHGRFRRGQTARSALLDGFQADVSAILDAE